MTMKKDDRKNPNPICPVCGEHVRGLDYYLTGNVGQKIASRWQVECYRFNCPTFGGQGRIIGTGSTLKQARDDYRAQVAVKRQGGE